MWPLKYKDEDYNLYETCLYMCDTLKKIGVSIDGGKDSLSMSTRINDEHIRSPGTIVISGYADCPDINDRVTADFKEAGSNIIFIDLGHYKNRIGGTAYAQIHGEIGSDPPDLESSEELVKLFNTIQYLITNKLILSGHDKSDGGLITTILEMCFASDIGCDIDVGQMNIQDINRFLFNEEVGVVIEVSDENLSLVEKQLFGLDYYCIGKTKIYDREPRLFDIRPEPNPRCLIKYHYDTMF